MDEHQPASCAFCKVFTKPALKRRLERLWVHLWQKLLCPLRSDGSSVSPSILGCSPLVVKRPGKSTSSGSRSMASALALKPPLGSTPSKKKKKASSASALQAPTSPLGLIPLARQEEAGAELLEDDEIPPLGTVLCTSPCLCSGLPRDLSVLR